MKTNLLFDFSANKENNTIHVKREFDATLDLVWAAWTTAELLDLWWAPKPYYVKTKSLEFKEGGRWFYGMVGPDDNTHWCIADYINIDPLKSYSALDAFCDEHQNINTDFPRSHWTNAFAEKNGTTTVTITIAYEKLTDLEKIIELGFKEGFAMAMDNLDQYFAAQGKLRNRLRTSHEPRVCTYLNFPGNTEEAFTFYKSVFKTEFTGGIQRFGDIPADNNQPPIAEAVKKMVLHVELPITGNHVLMATDSPKEMGFTVTPGNNMHISIEPESKAEARRIFESLAKGANITMPLQDMFWGACYGTLTDAYGINWMVNYKTPAQ